MGLQEGYEVEAGAGEGAANEGGRVLHSFQPGLDRGGELGSCTSGEGSELLVHDRVSFGAWVRVQRLRRCRGDLIKQELSRHAVSEIATRLGFPSAASSPALCTPATAPPPPDSAAPPAALTTSRRNPR